MAKLRDLGYIETLCHMYDQKLFGTTKISLMAKVVGPLNETLLKQAAKVLYQRQTLLQASIKFVPANFYFDTDVSFEAIPITIKKITAEADADNHFNAELDRPLVCSKYLWRLTLLTLANDSNSHFILMTIHHTIADGVSFIHLLEELLHYCRLIYLKQPPNIVPLQIRPAMEDILPADFEWEQYIAYWRDYYAKKRENPNFDAMPPPATVPKLTAEQQAKLISNMPFAQEESFAKREHKIIGRNISAEKVEKLHAAAKAHNTTIQAALGAAMLKTAQKQFSNAAALNLYTAVDFRNKCKDLQIPSDELGCYTYTMSRQFMLDVASSDFWALAEYYRQTFLADIVEQKQSVIKNSSYTNLSTLVRFDDLRNAKQFRLNFLMTNLGRVTFSKEMAPFKISYFRFLSSQMSAQYVLTLSLQTFQDVMSLTFCYLKPLVTESWMRKFVADFMDVLEKSLNL